MNEGSLEEIPTATIYCIDCRQKLCERCSRPHRIMAGGAHQLKAELEQELIQLRGSTFISTKISRWSCSAMSVMRKSASYALQLNTHSTRLPKFRKWLKHLHVKLILIAKTFCHKSTIFEKCQRKKKRRGMDFLGRLTKLKVKLK